MGVLLKPTLEYGTRKANLSPERRELLDYEEEEIASDPEQFRTGGVEDIRFRRFDFGFIAFQLTSRGEADLIEFRFLDDPSNL